MQVAEPIEKGVYVKHSGTLLIILYSYQVLIVHFR